MPPSNSANRLTFTLSALAFAVPIIFVLLTTSLKAAESAASAERCGYAPLASLKYKPTDTSFAYVNPDAPKGGKLRLGRTGSFDSLNFLRYPGTTISDRRQIPLHITEYLFDSFLVRANDEPAGWYCLAATTVKTSPDLSSVTFTINENARFHDGKPVTVDDVIFTFNTLKKQGPPYYRQVLRAITIEKTGDNGITYTNKRHGDRNFPPLVGTLPIHPAHFWQGERLTQRPLDDKTMLLPLGSGPYKITAATAGKSATLSRVKSYWARDSFTQKGRYNFDEIVINYFRDDNSALASFKVGNEDLRQEFNTVTWSREYNGPALEAGRFKQITIPSDRPGDATLLAFNQRRALFKHRRVRKAFALLYDFETANRILFHGLYEKTNSVYGSSPLAATGKATTAEEKILAPHLKSLPDGLLQNPAPQDITANTGYRQRFRMAAKLLDEAGFSLKGAKRIDPKTGQPMSVTVSYLNPRHQRILLHYAKSLREAGITLELPALAPSAARKKALDHDFDLALLNWNPDMLAGTSEMLLWGSRLADVKGSYALAGIKDKAIDHAIMAINRARSFSEMTTATKAFDRIFNWQIYAIPLYRSNTDWVSYWTKFARPETTPAYILTYVDRWWAKELQQSKLDQQD